MTSFCSTFHRHRVHHFRALHDGIGHVPTTRSCSIEVHNGPDSSWTLSWDREIGPRWLTGVVARFVKRLHNVSTTNTQNPRLVTAIPCRTFASSLKWTATSLVRLTKIKGDDVVLSVLRDLLVLLSNETQERRLPRRRISLSIVTILPWKP